MRGVTGATLFGEVERYCKANGLTRARFARASGVAAQTLSGLPGVDVATASTAQRIREFIAAHPGGVRAGTCFERPEPAPPIAPPAASAAPIVEQIAGAALATPSDLVRHVTRRWPEVWAAVVERARADGLVPGAALVAAIERGLALEVTCG